MSHIEKEKLIKADIASIENRVRHAFNQGYDLGFKDGKKRAKPLEQEPTTKNDLGVNAVSRDSAIKALDYDIKHFEFKSGVSKHMDDIAKLLNTIYETQVNNIKALPSVTPQEPILDKIKDQIEDYLRGVEITLEVLVENDPLRPKMEGAKDTLEECLNLIDKAEAEADNG